MGSCLKRSSSNPSLNDTSAIHITSKEKLLNNSSNDPQQFNTSQSEPPHLKSPDSKRPLMSQDLESQPVKNESEEPLRVEEKYQKYEAPEQGERVEKVKKKGVTTGNQKHEDVAQNVKEETKDNLLDISEKHPVVVQNDVLIDVHPEPIKPKPLVVEQNPPVQVFSQPKQENVEIKPELEIRKELFEEKREEPIQKVTVNTNLKEIIVERVEAPEQHAVVEKRTEEIAELLIPEEEKLTLESPPQNKPDENTYAVERIECERILVEELIPRNVEPQEIEEIHAEHVIPEEEKLALETPADPNNFHEAEGVECEIITIESKPEDIQLQEHQSPQTVAKEEIKEDEINVPKEEIKPPQEEIKPPQEEEIIPLEEVKPQQEEEIKHLEEEIKPVPEEIHQEKTIPSQEEIKPPQEELQHINPEMKESEVIQEQHHQIEEIKEAYNEEKKAAELAEKIKCELLEGPNEARNLEEELEKRIPEQIDNNLIEFRW